MDCSFEDHDEVQELGREPWLGVELRHLIALVAVATEGSFSSAAARLGYVQSAVSQQISVLERIVGARLVERNRGPAPVTLTRAGMLLLEHAELILAQLRVAHGDVREQVRQHGLTLTLGVVPELAIRLVPRLLAGLRRRDDVAVVVRELWSAQDLLKGLRAGDLDAVMCEPPDSHEGLGCRLLLRDRFVLLTRPDSPVARCAPAQRLEQLAAMPLIVARSSSAIDELHERMTTAELVPRWVLRTEVGVSVPALVRAGVGCAILPRLAAEPLQRDLAIVELGELLAPRAIALLWRLEHDRSPPLAALREEAEAAGAALAADDER